LLIGLVPVKSRQDQFEITIASLICAAFLGANVSLGIGLGRLRAWARWCDVVLIASALTLSIYGIAATLLLGRPRSMIGCGVAASISGLLLYLLLSSKSLAIFSPEYRAAVAATPHLGRPTRQVFKTLSMALAALIAVILLVALASA
jgi:hypothetical protein